MTGVLRRYVKVGSRPCFDSAPEAPGALANLFQCRFKSSQLFRVRIGKDLSNFGGVFAKNRRDQFFTFWSERYDPDAPILRTLDPAYQAPNGRRESLFAERLAAMMALEMIERL